MSIKSSNCSSIETNVEMPLCCCKMVRTSWSAARQQAARPKVANTALYSFIVYTCGAPGGQEACLYLRRWIYQAMGSSANGNLCYLTGREAKTRIQRLHEGTHREPCCW